MRYFLTCLVLSACATMPGPAAEPLVSAQPLALKSAPRGPTLFHELTPAETGIVTENKYDDPRMWKERFRPFLYGSLGSGVAIGDYDGDGRPDVLIVSKVEGHRLFRNEGGWHFTDVTTRAGLSTPTAGEWEQGATWTDVNNDGRLDLYVCRSGAPNLLYVNQGDGTFKEQAAARGLALNDDSVMAYFCDYDRDGWLDVYVVTNMSDGERIEGRTDYLFRNNGDGTFADVTEEAGIGHFPFQGHAAMWWDYDNDGWPDLLVGSDFSLPDVIYHNEGGGRFSLRGKAALPHTATSSMGMDTGDLNNDGWIDLLESDMAPTTHEKEYRTIADARTKLNPAAFDPAELIQLPRNALFLNTGTGFCLEAAELAGLARSDWTWSVRCEDLDCDGWLDVHITTGMNREQTNVDLTKRVSAAESEAEQVRVMKAAPVLNEANLAFRNTGDLKFEDVSAAWGLNQVGVSFGAALGDLDGDGDLDLVYTNYGSGATVLRNDCDTGHRIVFHLHGRASNRLGIGATVRLETGVGVQVRQLELGRGYLSSSEPMLHFGLGSETHVARAVVVWPSGHEQVLTDLAVDCSYAVTEPDGPAPATQPETPPARLQFTEISQFAGLSHLAREADLDESRVQLLAPRTFNHAGPGVAVGDLNGDGWDDVCFGGTTEDAAQVLLADGDGNYVTSPALAAAGRPRVNDGPVLIFDANGDDRNDLLLTAGGVAPPAGDEAYQPRLWANEGRGQFRMAPADALPDFREVIGAAAAADFDRDGQVDLFLGGRVRRGEYPAAPRSALLRNRHGHFEDVTDTLAPELREVGNVTSCLWTDVNHDGRIDLLLTLEWGSVEYFENEGPKGFVRRTQSAGFDRAGTGLWSSLAAADFNGDGRMDYVAGNLGLNTPYRASPDFPLRLFRGRFLDQENKVSLEAYYENGLLYPRNARTELGTYAPALLRRFGRTDIYARATLPEILGEAALAAADGFAVTQLQSGVFLSQPDGTFAFSPLPRIAQVSPTQGLVAGDFDGDGHADIVAVQNSDSYNPTAGRFDGGLGQYLRGDGHGNFAAIPPVANGFLVPGDARAVALINFDGDGWPDFLITRSRGASLAWQNRGLAGNRLVAVRLHGPAGNRTCIGAQVQVVLADGAIQAGEIFAGGGVLTQSSAELYFGCPPANPARRIVVRWPSGQVTETLLDRVPARIELTQPAQ